MKQLFENSNFFHLTLKLFSLIFQMSDLEKELVNVSSASDIKDVINDFHSRVSTFAEFSFRYYFVLCVSLK